VASIISRGAAKLFISYAPGTGSTSFEQHIRTNEHLLRANGFDVSHYPVEEFGEGSGISRHICYTEYLSITGNTCDYVATGVRNPFSFYFAEYHRLLSKWCKLLDDSDSWIYSPESKSTLDLALNIKNYDKFDTWFFDILLSNINKGYLAINENHLNQATHFVKVEEITKSFDRVGLEIFSISFSEIIGAFPIVNATDYLRHYSSHTTNPTKKLAFALFSDYLNKFGYSFETPLLKTIGNNSSCQNDAINIIGLRCKGEVTQSELLSAHVDFCLLQDMNEFEIDLQILNDSCQVAFRKSSTTKNVTHGNYGMDFSVIANLPIGCYVVEVVFTGQTSSEKCQLSGQGMQFEFQVVSICRKLCDGYVDLPLFISVHNKDAMLNFKMS